ncbi:hypothetical protein V6N13_024050 [Hibiscus sabdariffa]|uniref:Uncharacterized protein n=1 Tax=Hibiscus sabdariffa TaxID=183260 RepID=A0ABR2BWC4_9ROSI
MVQLKANPRSHIESKEAPASYPSTACSGKLSLLCEPSLTRPDSSQQWIRPRVMNPRPITLEPPLGLQACVTKLGNQSCCLQLETNLITNKKKSCSTSITIAPSDLAEQPELFPTNSPELGMGAKASESGHCGGASVGKNEDIPGAFTRGKTAGEAEIAGSLATVCKLDKKMTNGTTEANNLELVVDMDEV